MKRVLMIAYHFPPIQGSSGVHRTVQFARHLPDFGWSPLVVSVHPRAYPSIGDDLWAKMHSNGIVKRAFAMDSARHLAVKGRYLGITAIPDRWISWWPAGVWECLRLIRKYKPHVLWSTFPIATAHLIGLTVSRLTGLPWVADFRDPMIQKGHPSSRLIRKAYLSLEKKIVSHSSSCTLVTHSALDDYRQRYPGKKDAGWQVIENGYDESLFESCDHLSINNPERAAGQPIKILHSGILYSSGRNPQPFLNAVKSFIEKNRINIEITFRGSGNEMEIQKQVNSLGLTDIVKLLPSIPYDEAIKEMIQSDVLLLLQGSVYNRQIPAKVYEYIRAGHPILALTDEAGETNRLLQNWDGVYLGDITSKKSIENELSRLFRDVNSKKRFNRNPIEVSTLSRHSGTKKFAELLNQAAKKRS